MVFQLYLPVCARVPEHIHVQTHIFNEFSYHVVKKMVLQINSQNNRNNRKDNVVLKFLWNKKLPTCRLKKVY